MTFIENMQKLNNKIISFGCDKSNILRTFINNRQEKAIKKKEQRKKLYEQYEALSKASNEAYNLLQKQSRLITCQYSKESDDLSDDIKMLGEDMTLQEAEKRNLLKCIRVENRVYEHYGPELTLVHTEKYHKVVYCPNFFSGCKKQDCVCIQEYKKYKELESNYYHCMQEASKFFKEKIKNKCK